MKHLRMLCISVFIGFIAGLSTPSWADDTDLYLNQALKLSKETYPNVLFMLDNSGSMNDRMRTDDGVDLGVTRMAVLKKALEAVINDANSVNLGLARFTFSTDGAKESGKAVAGTAVDKTNAPIMYPVAYVDAALEEVESGSANASVMIPSSATLGTNSDDAEELVDTKKVSISDPNLEMVTQEVPPGVKTEIRIASNRDQAMEYTNKSVVVGTAKAMFFGKEITNVKSNAQDNGEVLTAVRFPNLGIPQGATIHKVEADFTSDEGPLSATFKDWDEDIAYDNDKHPLDLAIEGSSGVQFDKNISGALSNTSETALYPRILNNGSIAKVNWPIRGTVIDRQVYTTPDLASILQPLVKAATWAPEGSFILLFKRTGTIDESARRGFVTSGDNSYADAAPLLRVYWSLSGDQKIIANRDTDVGKYLKSTSPDATIANMRLGYDPAFSTTPTTIAGDTVVGVRFKLPIPAGAKISEAKIVFTRQGKRKGTTSATNSIPTEDFDGNALNTSNPQASAKALNLKIRAEKVANADQFPRSNTSTKLDDWNKHLQNPQTTEISWLIPATTKPVDNDIDPFNNTVETLDQFETPNLAKMITEITQLDDWKANNYIAFLFEKPSGDTSTNYRRFVVPTEDFTTASTSSAIPATDETLPRLEITFSAGVDQGGSVKQLVGLRFENVEIPQGAKVTKASIDFTGGSPAVNATSITVQAEDADDAKTFSNAEGDISSRKLTTAKKVWNAESWPDQGVIYPSVDISEVVQAVVNRSGWCGGTQAMAFVLSGTGLRNASAFDHSPDRAPVFNFEYDMKQISGNGCINQSYRTQVSNDDDDAIEITNEFGKMYLTSALILGRRDAEDRTTAFRFRDVPFDNGVTIMKAELLFTAATNTTRDQDKNGTITIKGQKTSAADFTKGDYDLTGTNARPKTDAKVLWTLANTCATNTGTCTPLWKSGVKYAVDVTPIVQEMLSQSNWEKYNNMAFFFSGTGRREAHSAGTSPAGAAQLRIQVQGSLGKDLVATVRTRLKQIAKELKPSDFTPIVDALYESGIYYRGEPVTFGKDRYEVRNHFVSHPATYTGGKVDGPLAPYQCTWDRNSKPPVTALNCQHEKITGEAQYKSPMSSPCQNSYIVLLSDGIPTKNTSKELVQKLAGVDKCQKVEYEIDGEKQSLPNGECGFELAEFLNTEDNAPSIEGTQKLITHTIGFQLGKGWQKVEDTGGTCIEQGLYVYDSDTNGNKLNTKKLVSMKNLNSSGLVCHNITMGDDGKPVPGTGHTLDIAEPAILNAHSKHDWKSSEHHGNVYDYMGPCDPGPDNKSDFVCIKYESKYVENEKETRVNAAAQKYLADLAETYGGGKYYPINAPVLDPTDPDPVATAVAETVKGLKFVMEEIILGAKSTSFAAPSISVSTVSRMYHKNEVYFALFKPGQNALWEGNIKKYRICEAGGSCKAGDIIDATGDTAVANSYIKESSLSIWTDGTEPDGSVITQGGAGAKIPSAGGRKIYTYTSGDLAPGENHAIALSTETVTVTNKDITAEMLGITTQGLSADQKEQKRKELINWIRGELVTGEQRWKLGDPLHSSPVAIVYAGSGDKKETTRLFVGTNDGMIRMIDADDDSGQEVWAFLPQELLSIQADLQKNEEGYRIYGVDATPTFLLNDGGDGIIDKEKGDSAKMFIGMRRGGTNLYALDVTDPENPQLMWVIKGSKAVDGSAQVSSPGFERLGQTWSKAKPARVARYSFPVLLFGGGYNATQDESFTKVDSGNAIYMVNAETGELVWWASSSKGKTESPAPFLGLTGMDYAIPSDLALVDATGSGTANRIYVGDVNGQVWRIDLEVGANGVGGRLAAVAGDPPTGTANADKRRFFYPPDVVTKIKSGDLVYDLVVIVSGTRPDPLGTSTHDQFYAIRDFSVGRLIDRNEDGNADTDNTKFATVTVEDMVDVTGSIVPQEEGESSVKVDGLKDSKGWYVNLNRQPDSEKENWVGEKGLAAPIVLKGKVYFTTYLPPSGEQKDPCKPSEGKSFLYSLDILTGETALNNDELALELKAGITSDIVLYFGKEGIRLITNDFSTPTHEALGDGANQVVGGIPGGPGSPGGSSSNPAGGCGAGCYTNPADPIFWLQE